MAQLARLLGVASSFGVGEEGLDGLHHAALFRFVEAYTIRFKCPTAATMMKRIPMRIQIGFILFTLSLLVGCPLFKGGR